ncbi:MAG TPA: FAD-dependent oxidoreductase [Syntrophales bacterium]|nr:FAD-dependent oxidoreductase [Syntrophales bacterium]
MKERPFVAITYETTEGNRTGSWRFLTPRYQDKTSPCSAGCPAGEDVGLIEMLVRQGLYEEAWEKILWENPMPGVCGRVCFHPCEGACSRTNFDSPVAIHTIERFLADKALKGDFRKALARPSARPQKIAVVGSGPAGLSAAWFLSMLGYSCDIFEASLEAGGILRWGIPEYRLPLSVLRSEIARIVGSGVRLFTGKDVSSESFARAKKNYSAVFLGCGHSRGTRLGISGENRKSVRDGLDFLRRVREGGKPRCQGLSVIIGGGNTAVDVARTIMRLGGKAVVLYRRRREDMPAFADEISMAIEEGVELKELVTPAAIKSSGSRIRLTLAKMKIEGLGEDGRGRIVRDGNKTISKVVDHVFAATGAEAAETWYSPHLLNEGVLSFSHCIFSLEDRSIPVIYGGDLTNKTKNVAEAIASGKQAAMALDTFFERGIEEIAPRLAECRIGDGPAMSMEVYLRGPRSLRSSHIVRYEEINADYFDLQSRVGERRLPPEKRSSAFEEVDLGAAAEAALREAARCFNCGICDQCDNCYVFCPDRAVIRANDVEGRHINYDYCKGCGICATECPRNAVNMREDRI